MNDSNETPPQGSDPVAEIRTQRLRLEDLAARHARHLFAGLRDPGIYRYIDEQPPPSLRWLESRYRRLETRRSPDGRQRWLNWAVWFAPSRRYAGYVQATVRTDGVVNIAYVLLPEFRGKSVGAEAVDAMLRFIREAYGAVEFEARIDERNVRSIALVKRLGFVAQGRTRSASRAILYRHVLPRVWRSAPTLPKQIRAQPDARATIAPGPGGDKGTRRTRGSDNGT